MIEIDPQTLITAVVGVLSTAGGLFAGRRIGKANASKVEAEALEIAARAYDSIVATHQRLNASLGAQLDRVTGELHRVTEACEERDRENGERHEALGQRIEQLEADNSKLRVELLGRELIDTDDLGAGCAIDDVRRAR